ncbi:helix-turn-helix domain-containing protein [Noviherbaspirillum massiliense]|uniref:helix-turn-helix domain-containing protein n=1 Tax=Noviherbaspirillum massiliense TaxID=1465823 RepID=UPI00031F51E6|nr:helix-turn-helix domain-containing protein [Noviherbaspirillum massiliense]
MPAGLLGFTDLLHAANRRTGARLFEPVFVAAQAGTVECAHGHVIKAASSVRDARLDAVLIPGFWAESPRQIAGTLAANAGLIAALAGLQKNMAMWSYCTGVCLAAASGRLNGQNATITWWLADMVREQYPKALWQVERTSVFNTLTATASGVNGYLPIAQAFIETRISKEAYRDLTKLMVLPRPERTHHAFQTMNLIEQPNRLLRELHMIAERLPAFEATVGRLAAELHMTERTLARKVAAATGLPVASYVRRIKLNQVSERLIHTTAPAATISAELGFSSDSGMRRMFKELTALTPMQYRQAFGRS